MQQTIKQQVKYKGIALHSGKKVNISFLPAKENTGIIFRRTDLPNRPEIPAKIESTNDHDSLRRTILEKDGARVQTTEHILATMYAMGIDNLIIEIDNEESPIGDGSALTYVELIKKAGIVQQNAPREIYKLKSPIVMKNYGVEMVALPSDRFEITFFISYEECFLRKQAESFIINEETFTQEIAPARTFCHENEIEMIRDAGLGRGGNLENNIVICEDGYLNEYLRFDTEPVRHKILDLIGDLFLIGKPLKAHILSYKSGHLNNIKFIKKLLDNVEIIQE